MRRPVQRVGRAVQPETRTRVMPRPVEGAVGGVKPTVGGVEGAVRAVELGVLPRGGAGMAGLGGDRRPQEGDYDGRDRQQMEASYVCH